MLLADALREAGQAVPEWLEPSSMAHLMHHEDYRSWDKIVLARQRAAGDDGLPPVKARPSPIAAVMGRRPLTRLGSACGDGHGRRMRPSPKFDR